MLLVFIVETMAECAFDIIGPFLHDAVSSICTKCGVGPDLEACGWLTLSGVLCQDDRCGIAYCMLTFSKGRMYVKSGVHGCM